MRVQVFNRIPIAETYRSNRVRSMMNVSPEDGATFHREFDLPIDEPDWSIGAVVGPSGTGKSSIGRQIGTVWDHNVAWPSEPSTIYDCLCAEARDDTAIVEEALVVVGLIDRRTWLRSYQHLSNGEKFRADLAMILVITPDRVVVDEFTSTIDRALAKRVVRDFSREWRLMNRGRRTPAQVVVLACHHDILPWLDPDWALDTNTGEVVRGRKAFYDLGVLSTFGRQVGAVGTVVGELSA